MALNATLGPLVGIKPVTRHLARRTSRCPGTPYNKKWTPLDGQFQGEREIIVNKFKKLIYLKQNSFNFEHSYIFDGVPRVFSFV